jgi:hypothetical protein
MDESVTKSLLIHTSLTGGRTRRYIRRRYKCKIQGKASDPRMVLREVV